MKANKTDFQLQYRPELKFWPILQLKILPLPWPMQWKKNSPSRVWCHYRMSSRRPLSSLGLAVPVITKLLDSDFVYDDDVQSLKPTELSSGKEEGFLCVYVGNIIMWYILLIILIYTYILTYIQPCIHNTCMPL